MKIMFMDSASSSRDWLARIRPAFAARFGPALEAAGIVTAADVELQLAAESSGSTTTALVLSDLVRAAGAREHELLLLAAGPPPGSTAGPTAAHFELVVCPYSGTCWVSTEAIAALKE